MILLLYYYLSQIERFIHYVSMDHVKRILTIDNELKFPLIIHLFVDNMLPSDNA